MQRKRGSTSSRRVRRERQLRNDSLCFWFSMVVFCYVVMGNHLRLMLKTQCPNLGVGMRSFLSGYAIWAARRWQRLGHLFQGRYRAEMIEDETYQHGSSRPLRPSTALTTRRCRGDAIITWRGRSRPGYGVGTLRGNDASSPPGSDLRPDGVPNLTHRIETRLKASPDRSNDLAEILKRASLPDAGVHQANAKRAKTPRQLPRAKIKNKGGHGEAGAEKRHAFHHSGRLEFRALLMARHTRKRFRHPKPTPSH